MVALLVAPPCDLRGLAPYVATVRAQAVATIPPEQLDALVAPIALYPDPMLAQVLAASTYPLEIMQLQQWLQRNPSLKDKALADAVTKQLQLVRRRLGHVRGVNLSSRVSAASPR